MDIVRCLAKVDNDNGTDRGRSSRRVEENLVECMTVFPALENSRSGRGRRCRFYKFDLFLLSPPARPSEVVSLADKEKGEEPVVSR